MTHVAFVCDQTAVQPLLPQVVIGNCATFHVREWAQLNAQRPANVILVRQKSAWNNTELLKWIFRLLGAALRPLAARYQPILLMDACRVHLPECVAQSCASLGIWLGRALRGPPDRARSREAERASFGLRVRRALRGPPVRARGFGAEPLG